MIKNSFLFLFCSLLSSFNVVAQKTSFDISSPDKKILVQFFISKENKAFYTIQFDGKNVLKDSKLGLYNLEENFESGLQIESASAISVVKDNYKIKTGKRYQCSYKANKRIFYLKNEKGNPIQIIFQVSNDGVAFRYYFPTTSAGLKKITGEITSFNLMDNSEAWLQPMQVSKTGWEHTNPAYEEHYKQAMPAANPDSVKAGWVFPALFKSNDTWLLITEAAAEKTYCASRLHQRSGEKEYNIAFPQDTEDYLGGAVYPQSTLPWYTPWRIIAIGNLKTIAESTLGTDLAKPSNYTNTAYIKPGKASWSWILLKDNSIVFPVQKKYIDFAAEMQYEYCLIDADWDRKIGYDSIQILADYAKQKKVGLWLWYNSSGDWNTTKYSPKSKLITHEDRLKEFARLQAMGIKGIKVDFFGGDGQSVLNYYIDIIEDAAQFGLMVNCHGATLPRGLQRTYPNLMTMEGIRGEEMITFNQSDADVEATHAAMQPFTRNAFDPMDFTPMVLYKIPKIKRRTTSAFELALSVVFTSGVQHLAEGPDGMAHMPEYVKSFLQTLPVYWEDTKFIEGYPGKLVVLARKFGKKWYVAGINGENVEKNISLDISFLKNKKGSLLEDGETELSFTQKTFVVGSNGQLNIKLKANGGFVAVFD